MPPAMTLLKHEGVDHNTILKNLNMLYQRIEVEGILIVVKYLEIFSHTTTTIIAFVSF